MRVWKLEAPRDDEWIGCRWGYALAETVDEALSICKAKSGLPFNRVREKDANMLWPGAPHQSVCWQKRHLFFVKGRFRFHHLKAHPQKTILQKRNGIPLDPASLVLRLVRCETIIDTVLEVVSYCYWPV